MNGPATVPMEAFPQKWQLNPVALNNSLPSSVSGVVACRKQLHNNAIKVRKETPLPTDLQMVKVFKEGPKEVFWEAC